MGHLKARQPLMQRRAWLQVNALGEGAVQNKAAGQSGD
jgi:hypothetical protein